MRFHDKLLLIREKNVLPIISFSLDTRSRSKFFRNPNNITLFTTAHTIMDPAPMRFDFNN